MSEFKLPEYKYNTARGHLLKRLKIPSYTIETSYALFRDKQDQTIQPMGLEQWRQFGRDIAVALAAYSQYLNLQPNLLTRRVMEKKALQNCKILNSRP